MAKIRAIFAWTQIWQDEPEPQTPLEPPEFAASPPLGYVFIAILVADLWTSTSWWKQVSANSIGTTKLKNRFPILKKLYWTQTVNHILPRVVAATTMSAFGAFVALPTNMDSTEFLIGKWCKPSLRVSCLSSISGTLREAASYLIGDSGPSFLIFRVFK